MFVITVDTKLPSDGMGDVVVVCDYTEYMDELKGYYWSEDYSTKKATKNFAQHLSKHAKYQANVQFE